METFKMNATLATGSWADAILGPVARPAPYTGHGHGEETCVSCGEADHCDCPCETCISARRMLTPPSAPVSHIQAALDREWGMANFSGPGCPFCDSMMGGCSCWRERAEMHKAEERRRTRADRAEIAARIARGECTCDQMTQCSEYENLCQVCQDEEALRCTGCGQLQCKPDCCGNCGHCTRCCGASCKRCGDFESSCTCHDDREEDCESCGCGACEEHNDGREDDCCW